MKINNIEIRTGPEDDPELVLAVVRTLKGNAYQPKPDPDPYAGYQELTMPTRPLPALSAQATQKLPSLTERERLERMTWFELFCYNPIAMLFLGFAVTLSVGMGVLPLLGALLAI